MFHWSIIYSLHVSDPDFSSIPTKQEVLILTHFKLVNSRVVLNWLTLDSF